MASDKLKSYLPHIVAVTIFLLMSSLYFSPQLEGKVTRQGDIIHHKGASKELVDYKKATGHHSLWTNSMFSGMPTYQISIDRRKNILSYVAEGMRMGIRNPIGLFLVMMLSSYLMFILLGISPWISVLGAIAIAFSTNNFVLWEAGHSSKLATLSYTGLILAGMLLTYRDKLFAGGVIFTFGLSMAIYSNHPQMTYYLGLVCAIYVILTLVEAIKQKKIKAFVWQTSILIVGVVLAVGASFSQLWTTYEYNKDTMRGNPILEQKTNESSATSSSHVKGLDWNYAMQWSNGMLDEFSAFIPGVVGGGSQEPVSKKSAFNKALKRRGAKTMKAAPLYWGSLPFTSGPTYLGAIVFFFFVMGLFLEKGKIKWWIGLGVLLTFLLALGKNLSFFNHVLFDYLPLFNNFRTPNSVLSVTAFVMPLLSFMTFSNVLTKKYDQKEVIKALKWSLGILGGLALFFVLLGPSVLSFEGVNDEQLRGAQILDATIDDRKALLRSDALRSLILVLLSGGLIWAYIKQKISQVPVVIALFALIAFDFVGVGKRYLNNDDFVSKSNYKQFFKPRPVDKQILKDKDLHYRVHDLSINTFNSSASSYFHNTIGGYSAAKLQRYQDLIERHISVGNQNVLNMLNAKYFITQDQQVRRNPQALGNAWFVQSIKWVKTPEEEINSLTNFDPAREAVVNESFKSALKNVSSGSSNGEISLTKYTPDELQYRSSSSADQLAVFSEIWYGPDKGWNATIDGKETPIIRVNYSLRAVVVPAGKHEIKMVFHPKSYYMGQNVSLIVSLIIVLLLLLLVLRKFIPKSDKLKFLYR